MYEQGITGGVDEFVIQAGSNTTWTMRSGSEIGRSLRSAVAQLTKEDPQRALTYALALGTSRDREIKQIAAGWARADPVAANEWASELPTGNFRETVENGIQVELESAK